MIEKTYRVIDETGIHARPASVLVETSNLFTSNVTLKYNGKCVNLKSILGVMSLGIEKNAEIKIDVEGMDEEDAINTLDDVIKKEGIAE